MKASNARFIVLGGLCAAAALAYFTRNGVGPAESTIRADLHLTMAESGAMMSAFFWPYALCQIPAAMLAQRFGARWMLALYGVLWSLATAGMALGDVRMMTASRACMGVAQAGLVPVGVMVMARWFPRRVQASVSGAFSRSPGNCPTASSKLYPVMRLNASFTHSIRPSGVVRRERSEERTS